MTAVSEEQRTAVEVRPVAGYIGADITGVDISQPLTSEQVADIRAALLRYKVVFFRGQDLSHAAQVTFGGNFGELTYAHPHDEAPPENQPEIFTVDPRRYEERYGKEFRTELRRRDYGYFTGWHTDVTAAVNPPAVSILRAETVPQIGGDTQWTNLVAAYEGLSAPLREFVSKLHAEHRYGGADAQGGNGSYAKRIQDNLLVAVHPVIRVHPETGERALFVNPGFTSHVVELTA